MSFIVAVIVSAPIIYAGFKRADPAPKGSVTKNQLVAVGGILFLLVLFGGMEPQGTRDYPAEDFAKAAIMASGNPCKSVSSYRPDGAGRIQVECETFARGESRNYLFNPRNQNVSLAP